MSTYTGYKIINAGAPDFYVYAVPTPTKFDGTLNTLGQDISPRTSVRPGQFYYTSGVSQPYLNIVLFETPPAKGVTPVGAVQVSTDATSDSPIGTQVGPLVAVSSSVGSTGALNVRIRAKSSEASFWYQYRVYITGGIILLLLILAFVLGRAA